jgi:hypothetical protein
MTTIEKLMNYESLIDNINNDNLLVNKCVEFAERFILVNRCFYKINKLYKKFYDNNKENKDINNFNSFKEFLDSKNNIDGYYILNNDIKNNLTNKRYYDNTIMHGENNSNMNFGEYEFKKIIFESLSNIFDINKLLLYQILNVN